MLDAGVLSDSVRYYHEADPFTEKNLYYIPHAGQYHCNSDYEVRRIHLDVCQAIVVDSGELTIEYRGKTYTAPSGAVVLLDCREPHCYYASSSDLKMRWFHFLGSSSEAYVHQITRVHDIVMQVTQNAEIEPCIAQIMKAVAQEEPNPHLISVSIHRLLALLITSTDAAPQSDLELVINSSVSYIESHYSDPDLSNENLARMAMLSTCYYVRKFKEFRSATPHQFIQSVRIRIAKQKLSTTALSIEEIAEQCGFCNTSHFIMVFRRITGITPLQFRIMWR